MPSNQSCAGARKVKEFANTSCAVLYTCVIDFLKLRDLNPAIRRIHFCFLARKIGKHIISYRPLYCIPEWLEELA